ncbi:MAG: hypothetical protein ACR5KW_00055 [Wolbachia sp.]
MEYLLLCYINVQGGYINNGAFNIENVNDYKKATSILIEVDDSIDTVNIMSSLDGKKNIQDSEVWMHYSLLLKEFVVKILYRRRKTKDV